MRGLSVYWLFIYLSACFRVESIKWNKRCLSNAVDIIKGLFCFPIDQRTVMDEGSSVWPEAAVWKVKVGFS